jgi:hypothetical protein
MDGSCPDSGGIKHGRETFACLEAGEPTILSALAEVLLKRIG